MNENPSIPDDITPSALLDLGIFAVRYEVFALEHRVADIFHERLHNHSGRDLWVLRADMVARIYRECLPSCCLRRVFCNALTPLSPRQVVDEWSEWSRFAAPDGGEILLDIIKAMAKTAVRVSDAWNQSTLHRSMSSSLYDPCQFHDHLRQGFLLANTEGDFGRFFKTECSFRKVECFPDETVVCENFAAVEGGEAATATKEDAAMILEEALASAEVDQASCDEPAVKETAASCDESAIAPGDETVAASETSGPCGKPRAEPIMLCDETAAADVGPDERVDYLGAPKNDVHADTQHERQLQRVKVSGPRESIGILGQIPAGLPGLSLSKE